MNLYITQNGQQLGPYTLEEARSLWIAGTVRNTDLAWYEGLAGWIPLTQVAGITDPPSPRDLSQPLPTVVPQPDPTLLIRRLATAAVLFAVLFVFLFFVIFVVVFVIGSAISGAQASAAQHAQGFDAGYKVGHEAGRLFAKNYTTPIAGVSVLASMLFSALISLWTSFSRLLPWCRPKGT